MGTDGAETSQQELELGTAGHPAVTPGTDGDHTRTESAEGEKRWSFVRQRGSVLFPSAVGKHQRSTSQCSFSVCF